MARGLSEEKIALIQQLYEQYGTYSAVAKEVGCAPATVKKYVGAATTPKVEIKTIKNDFSFSVLDFNEINFDFKSIGDWGLIKEDEKEEYENLRKELM